jgi:hypothetical protein
MAITFFSQSKYSSIQTSFYNPLYGNYKFDTSLTDFGIVKERKMRKVNRMGSVLKLSEVKDTNSIYPMIDEFGYSFSDFFIFKSSWDLNYHLETLVFK